MLPLAVCILDEHKKNAWKSISKSQQKQKTQRRRNNDDLCMSCTNTEEYRLNYTWMRISQQHTSLCTHHTIICSEALVLWLVLVFVPGCVYCFCAISSYLHELWVRSRFFSLQFDFWTVVRVLFAVSSICIPIYVSLSNCNLRAPECLLLV